MTKWYCPECSGELVSTDGVGSKYWYCEPCDLMCILTLQRFSYGKRSSFNMNYKHPFPREFENDFTKQHKTCKECGVDFTIGGCEIHCSGHCCNAETNRV